MPLPAPRGLGPQAALSGRGQATPGGVPPKWCPLWCPPASRNRIRPADGARSAWSVCRGSIRLAEAGRNIWDLCKANALPLS